MFKLSIKQLLRTPFKALLFVLLLAAATMLLVLGAALMVQSGQKIAAAESQFKTIGSIAQKPDSAKSRVELFPDYPDKQTLTDYTYNQLLTPDHLDFEGAGYIHKPESYPYYMAYMPDYQTAWGSGGGLFTQMIVEFSPLEDYDGTEASFMAHVGKVHYVYNDTPPDEWGHNITTVHEEGNVDIEIYNHFLENPEPLKKDKTYIAAIEVESCETHNIEFSIREYGFEYTTWMGPFTTQCDKTGMPIEGNGTVPNMSFAKMNNDGTMTRTPSGAHVMLKTIGAPEEVTPGFYDEGGRGQLWLKWVDETLKQRKTFPVLAINSLELMPSKHKKQLIVNDGRDITDEEFASGANVCIVNKDFYQKNLLSIGDKIKIPMSYALYNYNEKDMNPYYLGGRYYITNSFSPLNADGEPYNVFWEEEYEIVGVFSHLNDEALYTDAYEHELSKNMIVVPKASVRASDENNIAYFGPMKATTTTFQIPNGTIDEFCQKLYAAVPGALELDIKFDDSGYSQVRQSLDKARLSAVLLFAAGLAASIAIVALLLYFFVIKEKKRTAIERSLGVSCRQCRVSIISGLMALAVIGTAIGSATGALLLQWDGINPKEKETVTAHTVFGDEEVAAFAGFDLRYSQWAKVQASEDDLVLDDSADAVQRALLVAAPVALLALIWALGVVLVNRNLEIEPVLLLSTRADE